MPELPEVETSLRGIQPYIEGEQCQKVIIRDKRLRWPVPEDTSEILEGRKLSALTRRGKYILMDFDGYTMLLHLGMSGSVRIVSQDEAARKHDHIDLLFANQKIMRFNDPRRFGLFLPAGDVPLEHKLLSHLGPEPLSDDFDADYLFQRSRGKQLAIKQFIMDSKVVVGVGNIYANEALFQVGIHPKRKAMRISKARYTELVSAIKQILAAAIRQGGTTLKDFISPDGKPGYFKQELSVYGRGGEPCVNCGTPLREIRMNNRTTVYCSECQR